MSQTMRKVLTFPLGLKVTKNAVDPFEVPALSQIQSMIAGNIAVKEAVAVELHSDVDFANIGLVMLDGYQLAEGDRVLVLGQTDPVENGIYVASSGVWTRATDADEQSELAPHTAVTVVHGDHAGRKYELFNTSAPVVDTDVQDWRVTSASSSAAADVTVDNTGLTEIAGGDMLAMVRSINARLGDHSTDIQQAAAARADLQNNINAAASTYSGSRFTTGVVTLQTGLPLVINHALTEMYPSSVDVYESATGEKITSTMIVKSVDQNSVSVQNDDAAVDVVIVIRK